MQFSILLWTTAYGYSFLKEGKKKARIYQALAKKHPDLEVKIRLPCLIVIKRPIPCEFL